MRVIDLRGELPTEPDNAPNPSRAPKDSFTVHYQGADVARDLTDEEAISLVWIDAYEHIRRDWSAEAGQQGGSGVMYVSMIAPSGTLLICRDEDEVLWHCGDPEGNRSSAPVQVICGPNTPPTPAQLATLGQVLATRPTFTAFPHKWWSPTQCPGMRLTDYVTSREWEDDMDGEQVKDLIREMLDSVEGAAKVGAAWERSVAKARLDTRLDAEYVKKVDLDVPDHQHTVTGTAK